MGGGIADYVVFAAIFGFLAGAGLAYGSIVIAWLWEEWRAWRGL